MAEMELPSRLTNKPNHEDFHPSFARVGVRIDGVERNDIMWYDARANLYRTSDMGITETPKIAGEIEPYWRYPENRQQRRARERWETTHG